MYQWRALSAAERAEVLESRLRHRRPWHGPPHWSNDGPTWYHITGASYEHAPVIGVSCARMDLFSRELLSKSNPTNVAAWCVLPNHYHLLIQLEDIRAFGLELGRLHGRSSRCWNLEDGCAGRKVFHRAADRHLRSEAHFWATLNYIHHNPVRHGYVVRWTDWAWSSSADYLGNLGRAEALRIWRMYPILEYGKKWDAPEM